MKFLLVLSGLLATFNEINGELLHAQHVSKKHQAANDICVSMPSWTLIPDADNCDKFFVCANSDAEVYNCDAGYYFDRIDLRCKLGSCPYAQESEECQQDVKQRAQENCNGYTVCNKGKLVFNMCPAHQYYNPNLAKCTQVANDAAHMCSCILPEYTVVSNPDDCQTYYVCIDGKAILQQCPRGQYYNGRLNSCVPDLEGVCVMAPTVSPMPVEVLEMCESTDATTITWYPDPDDCAKYFVCLNGRVFKQRCQTGLYYDAERHICRTNTDNMCEKKLKQKVQGPLVSGESNEQHEVKQERPIETPILPPKKNKKHKLKPETSKLQVLKPEETENSDKFEHLVDQLETLKEKVEKKIKDTKEDNGQEITILKKKKQNKNKQNSQNTKEAAEQLQENAEQGQLKKNKLKEQAEAAIEKVENAISEEGDAKEEKVKENKNKEKNEKAKENKKEKKDEKIEEDKKVHEDKKEEAQTEKQIDNANSEEPEEDLGSIDTNESLKYPPKKSVYDKLSSKFVNL